MSGDWTDEQNDAIVADYFAMLADDEAGRPYSKAEHNHRLQAGIGRSHKSIEFKHRNVSAVLKGLGEDWIPGYRPAFHYQRSLEDAVARWLTRHPAWLSFSGRMAQVPASRLQDISTLWIGPPPTHSNTPPPDELQEMMAVAAKFDVAGRDERNRALGRAGEQRVVAHERATLTHLTKQHAASVQHGAAETHCES
jgi:hypothetical protein